MGRSCMLLSSCNPLKLSESADRRDSSGHVLYYVSAHELSAHASFFEGPWTGRTIITVHPIIM
eukprot:282893-Amphidinium_carterae.1